MAERPRIPSPPLAFGVASLVLACVGTTLFFLPILGTPISVIGIAAGVVGCAIAWLGREENLRWSVAGVVLSLLALGINAALASAPRGYLLPATGPEKRLVPDRPYVPPPAR